MKCIILAAGYATRLYPLTKHTAKPLLKVGDQTILQHILDKVEKVDEIDDIYIVTNDRFYRDFCDWVATYAGDKAIEVINDHTTSNDNRLGAIADIQYVLREKDIQEDIMVLAGDNLFELELTAFVDFYHEKQADCITVHELNDTEEIKRSGVVQVDGSGKVTDFEEKPAAPKSNLAVPPFYMYQKETLPLIDQYLSEGNNPDAPGNFIPWLIQHKDVYAYPFTGIRYDIGTLESYEAVQQLFR